MDGDPISDSILMRLHSTQTDIWATMSVERSFECFLLGHRPAERLSSSSKIRHARIHPIPIEPRRVGDIYYDRNNSNSNNSILCDMGGAQGAGVPRFSTTLRPEGKNPGRCHFPRVKVLLYNLTRPARVISSFHMYIYTHIWRS